MAHIAMEYWDRDHSLDSDGNLYSATIPYIVIGYTDEMAMLAYAKSQIPATLEGIALDKIDIEERIAADVWRVKANYPHKDKTGSQQQQEPEFAFDISAGTKHITHSIQTVGNYAPSGKTAPDFKGAINVNEKGEVQGVDIVNSTFSFTEKHYYDNSHVSNTFKRNVAAIVGRVNSSSFRGWNAGELLFMGASGSRRGTTSKDKWEITFRYKVSMNRTNVTVGDIHIPSVRGWDYLWVKYEDSVVNNIMTKKPSSAHVEQVYYYVSFSALN